MLFDKKKLNQLENGQLLLIRVIVMTILTRSLNYVSWGVFDSQNSKY